MYSISIVIPAYNAAKALPLTVDRIIKQLAFDSCQLILVNDGSTDQTLKICEDYVNKHQNIVVISQENKGVSAARNAGIKRAESEWIMFSDADDYYVEGFIDHNLFKYLEEKQECDFHIFTSYHSNIRRNRYICELQLREGIINGRQVVSWQGHLGSMIFKKQFLLDEDVLFDEGISLNEDYVFLTKAFYQAGKISTSSRICYIHNRTSGSLTDMPFKGYNWVEAWERCLSWFEKHARNPQDYAIACQYCGAKIGSRKLFFAKHYLQKGHSKQELIEELNRRGIWDDLQNLPLNQVMGYQVKELELYQKDFDGFVRKAKREGIKIRLGLLALSIPGVRAIRDKKQYPLTKIEED